MQKLNLQILQKAFDNLTCEDRDRFLDNNLPKEEQIYIAYYIYYNEYSKKTLVHSTYRANSLDEALEKICKDEKFGDNRVKIGSWGHTYCACELEDTIAIYGKVCEDKGEWEITLYRTPKDNVYIDDISINIERTILK